MTFGVEKGESCLMKKGYVHVYCGEGKGKTTAALGLILRALGAELSVAMVQFMKGYPYSEVSVLKNLPGFELVQTGRPDYIYKGMETSVDLSEAARGMERAKFFVMESPRDLVVLDEISVAVDYGLVREKDLLDLIDGRADGVELVLTGRYPTQAVMDRADYISEILCLRHPYEKGVLSREGIDH